MRRLLATLCLPACALALAACGSATSATSTSAFSGVKREVAQRIADFQSNANSSEEKKICANDLAATIVKRLGGTKGCEAAIKTQLGEVDNLEVSVESVAVGALGARATATVKSIHEGKSRPSTMLLVKESSSWKISGL
jgi:hypothetical protein